MRESPVGHPRLAESNLSHCHTFLRLELAPLSPFQESLSSVHCHTLSQSLNLPTRSAESVNTNAQQFAMHYFFFISIFFLKYKFVRLHL